MANEAGQAGVPEDMGGERELRIPSEPPRRIINGACGEARALLGKKECRLVALRHHFLALFQPGVECRRTSAFKGTSQSLLPLPVRAMTSPLREESRTSSVVSAAHSLMRRPV